MNGNIFNSSGIRVGVVIDNVVFGLKGQKLFDLKGSNIYKLNGALVGHLPDARGKEKRLEAWASANGATRSEAFRLHGAYGDGRRSSVQEDRH